MRIGRSGHRAKAMFSAGHMKLSNMNRVEMRSEDNKCKNEIYRLDFFEEAVGVLSELDESFGLLLATIGPVNLILPLDMAEILHSLLGERVGILRTDSTMRPYRVRVMSKDIHGLPLVDNAIDEAYEIS